MYPVRAIRVVELDVPVELQPLLPPAVDSSAVDTSLSSDHRGRQLVCDQQSQSGSSSIGEMRVGRIGHGRLLSVGCNGLNSLGRLPFLVQGMLQRCWITTLHLT